MRVISFLISRGFAIFLLIFSTGLLTLWNKYPNLYSSLFLIIPAFLFFSISLCIVKRVMVHGLGKDINLRGSLIFHVGMLIVIAATFFGSFTRFFARVVLPQGVVVTIDDKEFSTIHEEPMWHKEQPFMSLRLDNFETQYAGKRFPVEYRAVVNVSVLGKDGYHNLKEGIEINKPLKYDGYRFLLENGKYSPNFILTNKDGWVIFNEFVNLSNSIDTEDVFYIEEPNLVLYTRFFPDVFKEGTKYGSRSPIPRNPAFGIKIVKRDNPFTDTWRGVLRKGEMARFDEMTLEFSDLKPYVVIQIVKDPSYWGMFAGWILIVGGLLIRCLSVWKTESKDSQRDNK